MKNESKDKQDKLIILSRDGVINEYRPVIAEPDDWVPIEGSLDALAKLHRAGFRVIVATNQPNVMQGLITVSQLNAVNQKMDDEIIAAGGQLEAIFFCPHTPEANCLCRKPSPTMLNDIADRFNVCLSEVVYVGDTLNDMLAAHAAGCKPYLVLTGKGGQTYEEADMPADCHVRVNLAAVVQELVGLGRVSSK